MTSSPCTGAREQRLHDRDAFFAGMHELPDGMYLRDPAGNFVEIDWPDVSTLDMRIRADLIPLSSSAPQTGATLPATLYLDRRNRGDHERRA